MSESQVASATTLVEPNLESSPAELLRAAFDKAGNADGDPTALSEEFGVPVNMVKRIINRWKSDNPVSTIEDVVLAELLTDYGTQMRPRLTPDRVAELKEAYTERLHEVDPIEVYRTPDGLLLVDGYHRHSAALEAGLVALKAKVVTGSTRDAILKAVAANARGSLPRDAATKRNAILTLLKDDKWKKMTVREMAKATNTSMGLVHKVKEEFLADSKTEGVPAADRNGDVHGEQESLSPEEKAEAEAAQAEAEAKEAKKTEAEKAKAKAAQAKADKEYVAQFANVRDQLSPRCRKIFDEDALAWRDIQESDTFKEHKKTIRLTIKDNKPRDQGPFMRFASKTLRVKSPLDWKVCVACSGKGETKVDGKASVCKKCGNGDGYVIF